MQQRRFFSAAGRAGLLLGPALMLADCAPSRPAPEVSAPRPADTGFSQVGDANVALVPFQNSAFPYRGLIPNYMETGETKPFLDVNQDGRLGHTSPRGGLLWEDTTYNDRSVLLAAPTAFDPSASGVLVVFFHGNQATLERDVLARQQIVRQLSDSGLNGVLVAPQLALDAPDSSAGRFWQPGAFAEFLGEAEAKLAHLYPGSHGVFRHMPVVVVAYSGGYLPAIYSLTAGGASERVRGVVLLDALYGENDKFRQWVEGPGRHAFFVSGYSASTHDANLALKAQLDQDGMRTQTVVPETLRPGVVAFVDAGGASHDDFVTAAWTGDPLRELFSRMAR